MNRKYKMKELQELKDHYIGCGAGPVGRRIGQEITARGLDCVLIETVHNPCRRERRKRSIPLTA